MRRDDPSSPDFLDDVAAGLRVSDTQFDKLFPSELRPWGRVHWTPVNVALAASKLLSDAESGGKGRAAARILDVGSNVGKFCLVGALSTTAQFVGIERRRHLVDVARQVARNHRVPRVSFRYGDMSEIDWREFSGIYLFNPFHENRDSSIQMDTKVEFRSELFESYVACVIEKLRQLPQGTRVATYYGFGSEFPTGFERIEHEFVEFDRLELWQKV